MKTLLIVESPAKSKTIEKLLGPNYVVLASFGHIRNLDKENMGIDIKNNYNPTYKILADKKKQIKAIQEKIKTVDRVLLASDEDREGEAIAWHCAIVFKLDINEKNRICFHEITKNALENAVNNPRIIDMNMVYSQQARRILDRLVGFKVSPLLWKYIAPKLSAGRVQSAALKIIVDQENDIKSFTEKKYYKTIGLFDKKIKGILNINFEKIDDVTIFLNKSKDAIFHINKIDKKDVEKKPPPPYTTSTIQQDASIRFGIGSKIIMSILQNLYENGHITYHRTDSTNLSTQIQSDIKNYINDKFGKKYVHIRNYKSKIKCAQEAHEAIRPTHIEIEELNESFDTIHKKIYELIWKRTVSSQMSAALFDSYTITIVISNSTELFISKFEKILFDGYKKIYNDNIKEEDITNDIDDDSISSDFVIDDIKENEVLKYIKITSNEKYQQPPLRYTEASLIKKMEKIGIGRPSTYSNIIETIIDRKYCEKKDVKGIKVETINYILEKNVIKEKKDKLNIGGEKKKMLPTDLGINTTIFLQEHFMNILDSNFTATLEENLDRIANNNSEWVRVIDDFYNDFEPSIIKLNDKEYISKNDKKRFLGNNKEGKPVYAYIAKYGPVFQIGDKQKEIKYIKIDNNFSVNSVTIDDLYKISEYPKILGDYKDNNILLKKGIYGLYLTHNDINYKLLENMNDEITLEEAIQCIINEDDKPKSILLKKIDNYIIKNGQYGPYIHHNNKFYNIPKDYDLDKLTKEDCNKIIKIPKKVYKKI
jgi:DNA topoisomerase-1